MPAAAISNAALSESLAAMATELPGKSAAPASGDTGGGGFSALLNVAGAQLDNTQGGSSLSSGGQQASRDASTPTPPAAPIEVPALPPAPKADNTPAPADHTATNGNNTNNANTNTGNAASSANTQKSRDTAGNNASQKTPSQDQSSGQTPAQNAPAVAPQGGSQADTVSQAEGKLRDALSRQLDAINQILMSMLQAMTGVAAPVVPAAPAASSPAVSSGDGSPTAPTDAMSLLKDMQSLIQQLQQLLQTEAGQAAGAPAAGNANNQAAADTALSLLLQGSAPAPTQNQTQGQDPLQSPAGTTGTTLQQLIDALQTDNATLMQMLQQQGTSHPLSDATTASLLNTSQPAQADNAALLKDAIAQVRDQFQQLQATNDTIFQQAKADFQAQFAQTLSSLSHPSGTETTTSTIATTVTTSITTNAAPSNTAAGNNANDNTAAPVVTPPVSLISGNPAGAIVIAPMTAGQGGTGSSAGDNSGGGNQNQPAPVPSIAAAGQSVPTAGVSTISFARVLNQASSTPASLVDQVTFSIKTAASDGSSKIHIQLEPADLGKLDIQLNVGADGKTGIAITADNKNTLALLQRDAAGLMRALSDAGLSTSSGNLSFSLGGGQQQNFAGGQPASQAAATYQNAQPEEDTSLPVISHNYVVSLTQGLDITI